MPYGGSSFVIYGYVRVEDDDFSNDRHDTTNCYLWRNESGGVDVRN